MIVVRHPHIGAPHLVARTTRAHVVNAGDGKHQHPTQALLDLFTIQEALGRLEGVSVAIVGDVLHSRVARSLVEALLLVGAEPVLVAPPTLLPRGIEELGCRVSHRIDGDRGRRRRVRAPHAVRAHAGGRRLRPVAPGVHGALRDHARAGPSRASS